MDNDHGASAKIFETEKFDEFLGLDHFGWLDIHSRCTMQLQQVDILY